MTAAEFRSALLGLGLTGRQFARLFNADERTVRRWKAGDLDVSRWVPVALELLACCPVGARDHFIAGRLGMITWKDDPVVPALPRRPEDALVGTWWNDSGVLRPGVGKRGE